MAEIIQKDGTWTFDGDALRLTPGRDKNVSLLRRTLGELTVPLGALAGISFEQGKKSGRLRLRLRDGADPLLQATGGRLAEPNDPYQLTVESDRYGVAEYVVDEVRDALLLDRVAKPTRSTVICSRAPPCRCPSPCGDGTASFDGEHVRLEWNWKTEDSKSAAGARSLALTDLTTVEWHPAVGLENGYLRFTVRGGETKAPPKYDPNSVELWGFKKDPLMALVAAAVQARLPHPAASPEAARAAEQAGRDRPGGRSRRPAPPPARTGRPPQVRHSDGRGVRHSQTGGPQADVEIRDEDRPRSSHLAF